MPTANPPSSPPSPEQVAHRHLTWCMAGCIIAVGAAITWAVLPVDIMPDASASGGAAHPSPSSSQPTSQTAISALSLWKRSGPDRPTANAAPVSVTVFSIMRQGDVPVAVLDFKNQGGLAYCHVGETVNGVTITAINERGADVTINGSPTRLELGQ